MRTIRSWLLAGFFTALVSFPAGSALAGPDEVYAPASQQPCGKEHCCFCTRFHQAFDVTWPYEFCDDFDYPRPCHSKHYSQSRQTTRY